MQLYQLLINLLPLKVNKIKITDHEAPIMPTELPKLPPIASISTRTQREHAFAIDPLPLVSGASQESRT